MEMSGVQHQAQFLSPFRKPAQEGDRIRTAGETHGETKAGTEQGPIERERHVHERMITGPAIGTLPQELYIKSSPR
jgi:hypothetical protein